MALGGRIAARPDGGRRRPARRRPPTPRAGATPAGGRAEDRREQPTGRDARRRVGFAPQGRGPVAA